MLCSLLDQGSIYILLGFRSHHILQDPFITCDLAFIICLSTKSYLCSDSLFIFIFFVKDLLLFIWMMNEMLRMQFEDLTGQNLAGMGVGFALSGRK